MSIDLAPDQVDTLAIREIAGWRDCRAVRPDLDSPGNGRLCCIIPSYNYGQYIERAIDSVLAQTRPADEVIVIDDGSTDDTLARLEKYRGRIRVVQNRRNLGLAATRNRAIALTDAEYIVCVDADDWCAPNYFEVLTAALHADPGLGVVYTSVQRFDHASQQYVPHPPWPPQFRWEWVAVRDMPPRTMIPSSAMYRREMWRRAGGFFESYTRAEDAEFWLRGLATGWGVRKVTNEPLYTWRSHGDNLSYWGDVPDVFANLPFVWRGDAPSQAPTARATLRDYTDPAISVIVTIGPGHGRYAASAIESVIAQTFWNWELVIVDDSGEDLDLDRYLFAVARLIGPGAGASAARNEGLRVARAPFVLFLDGDDWLHPFALQKLAAAWLRVGQGYVYSDLYEYVCADDSGDVRRYSATRRELGDNRPEVLGMKGGITTLMLAEDARKAEFDETMRDGWEDVDWYLNLRVRGVCGTRLPEPLFFYRVQAGTLRRRANDHRGQLEALIDARFGAYKRGEKTMSPCCGGEAGQAIVSLKRSLEGLPDLPSAAVPEGKVRLQYIGHLVGGVWWLGKYYAGNNDTDRFVDVDPGDVQRLQGTGQFQVIDTPRIVEPAAVPIVPVEPPIEIMAADEGMPPAVASAASISTEIPAEAPAAEPPRKRGKRAA